jgi:hypothetical protein
MKAQQNSSIVKVGSITSTSPHQVFKMKFYPISVDSLELHSDFIDAAHRCNMFYGSVVQGTSTDHMFDHRMLNEVVGDNYNNNNIHFSRVDFNEDHINNDQGEMTELERIYWNREFSDSTIISIPNDNEMDLDDNNEYIIENVNNIYMNHPIEDVNTDASTQYGKPFSNDVLMGRGAHCKLHRGNQLFLHDSMELHEQYDNTRSREMKREFQERLVTNVYARNGLFMERLEHNNPTNSRKITYWVEVTDEKRIYLKAAQALREADLP